MTLSVQLTHRFADFTLDLSFEAPAGVTVLFGRSGAGKSSVVRAVAGLLRPDAGRITLDDRVLVDTAARRFVPPHRRQIGYVFQDTRLFPHLSLRQNLLYGRWFTRSARRPDPGPLLELLGLQPLLSRRVADLSGGEAARVALGRAILAGPRILLLDEPLASLDAARKAEVLPYLERLRDELALPMLYVTHSPTEALRLATSLVLLEAGKCLASGEPEKVLLAPAAGSAFGAPERSAILRARAGGVDPDGLRRMETAAGPVWLDPGPAVTGDLRLRILAGDVLLSLAAPQGLSALNVLPAVVETIEPESAGVLVRLRLPGGEGLFARVPRRAVPELGVRPGLSVFAVLRAISPLRGGGV